MEANWRKTKSMCVNERQVNGIVKTQGEEVAKVEDFKYVCSTAQRNGDCGGDMKKIVQAGWKGLRITSGLNCLPARVKGKV